VSVAEAVRFAPPPPPAPARFSRTLVSSMGLSCKWPQIAFHLLRKFAGAEMGVQTRVAKRQRLMCGRLCYNRVVERWTEDPSLSRQREALRKVDERASYMFPPPCLTQRSERPAAPLRQFSIVQRLPPPCAMQKPLLPRAPLLQSTAVHRLPPPWPMQKSVRPTCRPSSARLFSTIAAKLPTYEVGAAGFRLGAARAVLRILVVTRPHGDDGTFDVSVTPCAACEVPLNGVAKSWK